MVERPSADRSTSKETYDTVQGMCTKAKEIADQLRAEYLQLTQKPSELQKPADANKVTLTYKPPITGLPERLIKTNLKANTVSDYSFGADGTKASVVQLNYPRVVDLYKCQDNRVFVAYQGRTAVVIQKTGDQYKKRRMSQEETKQLNTAGQKASEKK